MKRFGALVAALVPGLAFAQAQGSLAQDGSLPYNANLTTFYEHFGSSPRDTPTMARERLQQALALRAEAAALLEADGGTFTPGHDRYIRRKARTILGY